MAAIGMEVALRKFVVGIMGGACADDHTRHLAEQLGELIARNGWAVLCGGRNQGVMESAAAGAARAGGLVIGILPGITDDQASSHLSIAIRTGLGDARNVINVLSCDAVLACRGGAGTLSEIALALKSNKQVVTVDWQLGKDFDSYRRQDRLYASDTPEGAIRLVRQILESERS